MDTIHIHPGRLAASALAACASHAARFELDPSYWPAVETSRETLQALLARHEPIYGINTGFGKLASTRIADGDLAQLQLNLVRSHCTGVGAPLAAPIVRRVLLLKAVSLAHGVSGVRREVIEALLALLNVDVLPVIPSQGSVGASGDLAPLAHLSAVLIGEGEAEIDGVRVSGADALARAGIAPLALGPKEGLALLNGTQVSTAIALEALARCERVFDAALLAGAMTTDAAQGSDTPFDDRIHAVRGQRGQREVATRYRALLAGSEIRASHLTCDKVQDPYCLRCQPQVMGACLDQMNHVREVLLIEANGVSDNPLIFAGKGGAPGAALSGGNFHAEPVAFAADNLALVIAEIGALAERRIAMLMDASISGLPPFLVPTGKGGLNSGFMIAQVTAAALASENKALAFPRSVDSLPTSANQEDHVSMATGAALRLLPMLENTTRIIAIELLCAAQGIELRRPLRSSKTLEATFDKVRAVAPFFASDRALSGEIAQVGRLIDAGRFGD